MINKADPTVFLIDDDPIIRQAIIWLLESVNLHVEAFPNGQSYLQVYDPTRHGCLLIDVRMPGMSGLKLQQELNILQNPIPIIFITGHGDVPMAVEAMQHGAKDFILKPFNDQILLEKIQTIVATDMKRENDIVLQAAIERFQYLTPREYQVMEMITAGKLNKQIAAGLVISMATVEAHRAKIMQKLQVKSLAELIKAKLLAEKTKQ